VEGVWKKKKIFVAMKDKARRLGPDAANPHRMAYKRLTR
jgi:hypothetical protein